MRKAAASAFSCSRRISAGMRPSDSPQSLSILRRTYHNGDRAKTISRNFWIREDQDELLEALSKYHGESKVTILRAIIDEWREMKLRDSRP